MEHTEEDKHGMFKPHLEEHTRLSDLVEEELKEAEEKELKSSELANRIAGEAGYSPTHTHALITQGRTWIQDNSDVQTEQRPEQSGGNPTIFWRHDTE